MGDEGTLQGAEISGAGKVKTKKETGLTFPLAPSLAFCFPLR